MKKKSEIKSTLSENMFRSVNVHISNGSAKRAKKVGATLPYTTPLR